MGFRAFVGAAVSIALLAGLPAIPESQARTPQEIYGPVFARYKNITDARKKLRKMEKKGEALTGDDYFAMAYACQYEEPASQSIILTALSRSACKDKTYDYFVEAGNRGTPEGFLAAAHWLKQGDQAYVYAQVAFQLAGGDKALESDALDTIASLRSGVSNAAALDSQAVELATRIASSGNYASMRAAATQFDVSNRLPNLSWLDFKDPKRCQWGNNAWPASLTNATTWNQGRMKWDIHPARVPNVEKPVGVRVLNPKPTGPTIFEYDFEGNWNGLHVTGLRSGTITGYPFEYSGTAIRFREPVDVVAARLAALGFPVNRDGSLYLVEKPRRERYSGPDGSGVATVVDTLATWVLRRGNETYFFCDQNDEWK